MRHSVIATVTAILLAGCAGLGTDGVVPIGPDMYMIGGLGGGFDYSGSVVKAKFFREAAKYCDEKGKVMVPVNSTGRDASYGEYASAEVQFRCLNADALRLPK